MRSSTMRGSRLTRLLFVVIAALAAMDGYVGLHFASAGQTALRRTGPALPASPPVWLVQTLSEADDEWSDTPVDTSRSSAAWTGAEFRDGEPRRAARLMLAERGLHGVGVAVAKARGPPAGRAA